MAEALAGRTPLAPASVRILPQSEGSPFPEMDAPLGRAGRVASKLNIRTRDA